MNKYIAPWYLLENYQDYRRIRLAVASIGNEVTSNSGGTIAAYVNRTNDKILLK